MGGERGQMSGNFRALIVSCLNYSEIQSLKALYTGRISIKIHIILYLITKILNEKAKIRVKTSKLFLTRNNASRFWLRSAQPFFVKIES